MRKIKTYSGFISVNELDTSGTYLDRDFAKYDESEYSKFRKIFGKVFNDAPNTSDVDYGLKYVGPSLDIDNSEDVIRHLNEDDDWKNSYSWKVIFPEDFYKHFIPKEENKEEWVDKNKDLISELMSELNNISISTEGSFNRTHFAGGIPKSLKGIGLGYVVYEGFVRRLGYASSRPDASEAAKKVWFQIAKDPDFTGMSVSCGKLYKKFGFSDMILVFKKDFKFKGHVIMKLFDEVGYGDWEDGLEDFIDYFNSSEDSGRRNQINFDKDLLEELNNLDIFSELAVIKERKRLKDEGVRIALSIIKDLFGDYVKNKSKIGEIREYLLMGENTDKINKEDLIKILKSNDVKVDEETLESDIFIESLHSKIKSNFDYKNNEYINNTLFDVINDMKKSNTYTSKDLQNIYDSHKQKLESLKGDLDIRPYWMQNDFSLLKRKVFTSLSNKLLLEFKIGDISYNIVYDREPIKTTKIPLDIIDLVKFTETEKELKGSTDEAFINSKKEELGKINIMISINYKQFRNANAVSQTFSKLKTGYNIENVTLTPLEHYNLNEKIRETELMLKMKNAYKYLCKELHKSYLEGGYEKALSVYNYYKSMEKGGVEKNVIDLDIELFDDPDYGLFKEKRPDVKLPVKEHIERRMKAYKETEDYNKIKSKINKNIDDFANKTAEKVNKSVSNIKSIPEPTTPDKEELEKKPIEKKSFIKRFMDFFK